MLVSILFSNKHHLGDDHAIAKTGTPDLTTPAFELGQHLMVGFLTPYLIDTPSRLCLNFRVWALTHYRRYD